nr:hypothetical protein [Lachnospiraceae bacterium]
MKRKKWFTAILLVTVLLLSACGGSPASPSEPAKPVKEENKGGDKDKYPYVVHTLSATWYLSADDIALLGEQAYYDGLYAILEKQEADFADAREALKGYIPEEVPVIDIYTDFCGNAAASESAGAYYSRTGNFIKLFTGWDMANGTLLHEYVHYLTIHCLQTPATSGLYAEGIAEYVSKIVCKNRMNRSINTADSLPEEMIAFAKEHGAWDEAENCADLQKYYFGKAGFEAQGGLLGSRYFSVSDIMEVRTEEIQKNPSVRHVSHYEAACITAYLIDTYSKDTFMKNLSTDPDGFEAVWGKSFTETYAAWLDWNMKKCAELGVQ